MKNLNPVTVKNERAAIGANNACHDVQVRPALTLRGLLLGHTSKLAMCYSKALRKRFPNSVSAAVGGGGGGFHLETMNCAAQIA